MLINVNSTPFEFALELLAHHAFPKAIDAGQTGAEYVLVVCARSGMMRRRWLRQEKKKSGLIFPMKENTT